MKTTFLDSNSSIFFEDLIGDDIILESLDTRLWRRFFYWVLCRPRPVVKKRMRIVDGTEDTLFIVPYELEM